MVTILFSVLLFATLIHLCFLLRDDPRSAIIGLVALGLFSYFIFFGGDTNVTIDQRDSSFLYAR